jgi:hypothetical protein
LFSQYYEDKKKKRVHAHYSRANVGEMNCSLSVLREKSSIYESDPASLFPKEDRCPFESILALYIKGAFVAKELDRIKRHVGKCPKCKAILKSGQELSKAAEEGKLEDAEKILWEELDLKVRKSIVEKDLKKE